MRTMLLSSMVAVALFATPALAQSSGNQSGGQAGGQAPPQVDCPAGQQRIASGECAVITGPGAGGGAAGAMMGGTSGAAGATTGGGSGARQDQGSSNN